MDYASLVGSKTTQGSIKSWVGYSKPPVTDIVTDAEAWCYQRLRVREMRASAQILLTAGVIVAPLPDRFLDPIKLTVRENSSRVDLVTEEQLTTMRVWDEGVLVQAPPLNYAIFDEQLNFDYAADDAYTLDMLFYQRKPALSTTQTNFLTDRYPLLFRVLCMGFAASYMKDYTEMKTQLSIADSMVDDIKMNDDLSRRGTYV